MMFRIFRALLSMLLCISMLTGCSKGKNSPPVSDSSEPDMPASVTESDIPAASAPPQTDYSALDTTLHGWGQGTIVDAKNCPVGATEFNAKYGKYNALFGGDTAVGKTIYLTFDEGYENGYTAKILDILKEKQVHAVFFVTMDYVTSEPELIRRMINEGHTVGNHSTTHPSMPTLSSEKVKEEIKTLHDAVEEKFHYTMTLFRPPKGEFSEQTLAVTKDVGYTSVFWSFAYKDWVTDAQPEQAAALKKLLSSSHDGAIYLLHAVSSTNTAILGDFIDGMQEKGYTFSTRLP